MPFQSSRLGIFALRHNCVLSFSASCSQRSKNKQEGPQRIDSNGSWSGCYPDSCPSYPKRLWCKESASAGNVLIPELPKLVNEIIAALKFSTVAIVESPRRPVWENTYRATKNSSLFVDLVSCCQQRRPLITFTFVEITMYSTQTFAAVLAALTATCRLSIYSSTRFKSHLLLP